MDVNFKCIDGTHYLCAEDGGGPEHEHPKGLLVANRTAPNAWETFTPIKNTSTGRWGFKSSNGFWLSAQEDGTLYANRERSDNWQPEAWEAFELVIHSDGRFSLKTDHGKFVCAEGGGGNSVIADRLAANAWESFLPSKKFWISSGSGGGGGLEPPTATGRLRVEDRFFVQGGQVYRPRWASLLSVLRRSPLEREELVLLLRSYGFNGVRVFAGYLSWAGQSTELARRELPDFLEMCKLNGMRVEVVPITDSATGYNVGDHTKQIVTICDAYDNSVVELANEYWHPTQSDLVHDPRNLLALRRTLPSYIPMSLGAPGTDEPSSDIPVSDYLTLHLDRSRDKWNMVRRVRELEAASSRFEKPVINNEPIGADELDGSQTGRQRLNDPSIFFCMGALNRIFEVGSVFHSQFGLQAEFPGPVQTECAQAFIRGFATVKTTDRVMFYNAKWQGSPVVDANFDSGALVRAYSGVWGNRGVIVLVGLRGNPELVVGNGWSVTETLDEMSGCKILGIAR